MSTDNDAADWDKMIDGLRSGNEQACREFWSRYGAMLQRVAAKHLSERLQRRVGPDDVVQSACRTFFRRVSDGQFDLPDADALWRLLCAITLTKARRAARDQKRLKREIDREQPLEVRVDGEVRELEVTAGEPDPLHAAMFADELSQLLNRLSEQECAVLDHKLQQYTDVEIAEKLRCSERTVRRVTQRLREQWNRSFDETDSEWG